MLSGNKSIDYLNLIDRAREHYEKENKTTSTLKWYSECKEINLWSYWQGFGYAEKTPEIDILLVGQDWGNPFRKNPPKTIANIQKINKEMLLGQVTTQYLDDVNMKSRDAQTDKNLITLFNAIGYPDIDKKRYEQLFFANFSLGYRSNGSNSGGMTITQLMTDRDLFIDLCDILQPKKIICLGKITYKAVIKTLGKLNIDSMEYSELLDNGQNKETIDRSSYITNVYGMAHCGYFGTRNRGDIPGSKTREAVLIKQIDDWKRIIKSI